MSRNFKFAQSNSRQSNIPLHVCHIRGCTAAALDDVAGLEKKKVKANRRQARREWRKEEYKY
jgi:hypothetical protein